jgi:hypothetical protein
MQNLYLDLRLLLLGSPNTCFLMAKNIAETSKIGTRRRDMYEDFH